MILYNASTSAGLRNMTRFLTNTNTTTYANADLDAALNRYYHQFTNEILAAMDDWDFQGEIATASMVADQQEYVLPTDILKIKKVMVSYDGSNWYTAKPFDVSETDSALATQTDINNAFSTSEPYVDFHEASIFLYPVPTANSTNGIKIYYEKEATELTAVTDEPVIAEAYHRGLAYGASKDFLEKYIELPGNAKKLAVVEKNLVKTINDMKEFYNTKVQERDYIVKPSDNGMDAEYGYDL